MLLIVNRNYMGMFGFTEKENELRRWRFVQEAKARLSARILILLIALDYLGRRLQISSPGLK